MIDEDVNLSTLLKDFETEKVTPPVFYKLMKSAKTKNHLLHVETLFAQKMFQKT